MDSQNGFGEVLNEQMLNECVKLKRIEEAAKLLPPVDGYAKYQKRIISKRGHL